LAELALGSLDQRIKIERYLDKGRGEALLFKNEHAAVVHDALCHFDSVRYNLHAWVIMPNHVHVLVATMPNWKMGAIIKSWKGFTSREIAKREPRYLSEHKRIWQPDYFDRYIRDHSHYRDVVTYLHENPVKAGLVSNARDWPWSSARALEKLR
jgi:REP element-mobilizing transposase RayT